MADLQRHEIAEYARVSPALISYYFPHRSSLFTAVAQPIVNEYVQGIRQTLANSDELTCKLRSLVSLYTFFNYNEGHLLDFYLQHCKKVGESGGLEQLKTVYQEIIGFFEELLQAQVLRGACAPTLHSMLWGMCKNVAENLREKRPGVDEDLISDKAEAIFDCFVNGAAGLVYVQRVANAA